MENNQEIKTSVFPPLSLILTFISFEICAFLASLWVYGRINNWKILVGIFSGLLFLATTLFSVEKVFFLLLIYLCTFPALGYFRTFGWLKIAYTNFVGFPIFALLVFYWIIQILMKKEERKFTFMDWAMLAFMTSFLVSSVIGILNRYPKRIFAQDFIGTSFFLTYFIFLTSSLKEKKIQLFFDIFWVISVIIGLEYLYSVYLHQTRIMSDHIHLTQLSVPYIGATLAYSTSTKRKILSFISLPIILLAVVVSFQRALWITTALLLVFWLFFLLLKKRFFLFGTLCSLLILLFGVGSHFFSKLDVRGSYLPLLLQRATSVLYPKKDISLWGRTEEIKKALSKRETFIDFIVGKGLGDYFIGYSVMHRGELVSVDNAYAYLLWKMGIIGLITYLIVLFIFFKRCFFLFRISKNDEEKIYSLTSLLFLGVMCVIVLTNDTLVRISQLTMVEALIFGIIEYLTMKYRMSQDV